MPPCSEDFLGTRLFGVRNNELQATEKFVSIHGILTEHSLQRLLVVRICTVETLLEWYMFSSGAWIVQNRMIMLPYTLRMSTVHCTYEYEATLGTEKLQFLAAKLFQLNQHPTNFGHTQI